MRLRLALAAVCALLVLPNAAPAAPSEAKVSLGDWGGANGLAISNDGRTLYAAGDQRTLTFSVARDSGALTELDDTAPGGGPIVSSPDSRFVYIGSGVGTQSSGIAVLSRAASGELLHLGTVAVAGPQATPVGTVTGLAVSPDGRNVYAVRRDDPSLMVFARNPSSGAIYLLQTIFADAAAPYSMSGPVSVAVAPDGTSVYESGSGGVTALARDAATGRLTFVPSGPCICSSAFAVAVSPDGARVYGALSDIESFTRDPSTGAIEELSRTQSVDSCGVSGTTIAVSPDGRLVVAGDERVGGIRVGTPTDKGLGDVRTYPAAAVRRIGGIVWSPDGRFLYVAAESGGSGLYCSNYTPGSAITVFRRDGDNLVQVEARHPVMRSWFPLNPGVTVNAGAQYTNSRDVTLTVTPPWPLASSALVANDGGFASGRMVRTPGPVQIPWRLDEGPAERTVRHVYVRFTPSDARPGLVVGDDVILDTRPPVVSSATSSGGWITVSARDKVSGVASLQLAQRRTAPKRFVRFHKRVRLGHGASPRWARVRDRAGNVSAWEQIRRAPRKRS